ncbi:Ras-related protein Rab-27A [Paragonimus westermani]|uniref:Ras-related protein Rab-27A n=1 Tax=Paragonimus westermani TaxID=34504 RepID=A0A5J4NZ57_9TREM|nr:Ras-related protein Rab-27A [Paragonimus westermani]
MVVCEDSSYSAVCYWPHLIPTPLTLSRGDSNVGKTSLWFQYTDNVFNPRFTSTVGVDFKQKRVVRESRDSEGLLGPKQRLHLQLWDTAGQERYRSLCSVFLRDAMGFLLVFDLTNEKSLYNCREWMDLLCQHAYCERPDVVLVGNKSDLTSERQVPLATATAMARELNVPYIETSAATGYQVAAAVDLLLDAVMSKVEASLIKSRIHNSTADAVHLSKNPAKKSSCAC